MLVVIETSEVGDESRAMSLAAVVKNGHLIVDLGLIVESSLLDLLICFLEFEQNFADTTDVRLPVRLRASDGSLLTS